MHRALALAETVRGRTSPNPPVGAVILAADGTLAGEGATAPARRPARRGHRARRGRRPRARRHRRRHPRAVRAHRPHRAVRRRADRRRRRAGRVRRRRPHPAGRRRRRHAARRRRRRSSAGVERRASGRRRARPWLHAMRTGRPFVTWKFAATLDGRVAAADGTRPLDLLRCVPRRRARAAGGGRRDRRRQRDGARRRPAAHRPRPDGELAGHQPLRVVLDRRHRTPQSARVLDTAAETLVLDTAVPQFALKALLRPGRAACAARRRPDARRGVPRGALRRRGRGLPGADAARRRRQCARSTPESPRSPRRSHWTSTSSTRLGRRREDRRPARAGRTSRRRGRACSPGSSRRSARSTALEARGDSAVLTVRAQDDRRRPAARRLDRGQRRLPHRRRLGARRRVDDIWTSTSWPRPSSARRSARRRPGDRVNLERAARVDARLGRAHRAGPRRRHRGRRLAHPATHWESCGSACRPSWPATSPRRARSPSTASR